MAKEAYATTANSPATSPRQASASASCEKADKKLPATKAEEENVFEQEEEVATGKVCLRVLPFTFRVLLELCIYYRDDDSSGDVCDYTNG